MRINDIIDPFDTLLESIHSIPPIKAHDITPPYNTTLRTHDVHDSIKESR